MVKYLLFLTVFGSVYGANIAHSFYGGANLGLNILSGKRNDTSTITHNGAQAILSENKRTYKKGISGGIFAGYLLRCDNFGIGPELFWNYVNIEDTIKGKQDTPGPYITDFDIKHRITNQYGINIRLGYFFDTSFIYALCGLHWQQYNFQVKAVNQDGLINRKDFSYNTSNKITQGNSIGLGVQKQLTPNYDIGFEYKLTNLPRKNYEFNLGDPLSTKLNSSLSYKLHAVSLRFICKI